MSLRGNTRIPRSGPSGTPGIPFSLVAFKQCVIFQLSRMERDECGIHVLTVVGVGSWELPTDLPPYMMIAVQRQRQGGMVFTELSGSHWRWSAALCHCCAECGARV